MDFEILSRYDFGAAGHLALDATFTHLISQTLCGLDGVASDRVRVDGTHGPTSISGDTGTPRNRGTATLSYGNGAAEGGLTVNYVSGYFNTDPTEGATGPGPNGTGCLNSWYTACYIGSFTDFDLFGRYDLSQKLQLNFHVLNLFNRDAPFDPQAAYGTRNYNNAFAQQGAIGRYVQIGVKYTL